ncbi:MAG: hypothetical protein ACREMH_10100 [Gemmatimonadales bacterium]
MSACRLTGAYAVWLLGSAVLLAAPATAAAQPHVDYASLAPVVRHRPAAAAGGSDTDGVRRLLQQWYASQDSAIARRDLPGFLATLSPR